MRKLMVFLLASLLFVSPAWAKKAPPDKENILFLDVKHGTVEITLRPDLAPKHVAQIKQLTRQGFYDGLEWFRVIDGFMAQTGYPKGKKGGKSDLPDLKAEFSQRKFKRGSVGMGHGEDPNSGNSQFFICFTDEGCADLTGKYTLWGEVTEGMQYVDAIKRGEPPARPDVLKKAYIWADMKDD